MINENSPKDIHITFSVPPVLHQEVKVYAAMTGRKIGSIYQEAVRQYLATQQGASHDHKCNHA